MRKLHNLLERKVERQDHEWMETMQRLPITERTEKRPVAIRSRDVERDCQSIVNQLVNLIPKDVLLRISCVENQQLTSTQSAQGISVELKSSLARRVQFTDAKRSTSRARTFQMEMRHRPEMRHCPGSRVPSSPAGMISPGSPCQDNRRIEFCS